MQKTGQVIRWDAERGFGFIRSPDTDADVFFHIRDTQGGLAPAPGVAVVYEEIHVGGKGPRAMAVRGVGRKVDAMAPSPAPRVGLVARPTARPAAQSTGGRSTGLRPDPWLRPVLLLALGYALLLALGYALLLAWAASRGFLPWRALIWWCLLNALTFWLYWRDKHAARQQAWRTPERTLHMLSLLGAWPAARVAQQVLRHKSAKRSFQAGYWATLVAHVAAVSGWLYLAAMGAWPY